MQLSLRIMKLVKFGKDWSAFAAIGKDNVMHNYLDKSQIQIFLRGKKIIKSVFLHLIDHFILYGEKYFI